MRESSPGHAREVDVRLSRQLARVMDDAVTVPGTRVGLGLDAVIGLVPCRFFQRFDPKPSSGP